MSVRRYLTYEHHLLASAAMDSSGMAAIWWIGVNEAFVYTAFNIKFSKCFQKAEFSLSK